MNINNLKSKTMSSKVMKLLDAATGLMECKVCGHRHFANIRPDSNGRYYKGSWQCGYGCKLEDRSTIKMNYSPKIYNHEYND
jgi:hypothetical protein